MRIAYPARPSGSGSRLRRPARPARGGARRGAGDAARANYARAARCSARAGWRRGARAAWRRNAARLGTPGCSRGQTRFPRGGRAPDSAPHSSGASARVTSAGSSAMRNSRDTEWLRFDTDRHTHVTSLKNR